MSSPKINNSSLLSLGFAILTVFLLLNILYSQNISPLYSKLMQVDQKASVDFLKKVRHQQGFIDFNDQLDDYKKTFEDSILSEFLKDNQKRQETIMELKEILNKNPKSRDALYSLYLLEKEEGNKKSANKYLEEAKRIDPLIK